MNINGAFRFHNVGQGLFYSGILSKRESHSHDVFSFVYDCGTESNKSLLRREIDDYKLLLPRKKLNLLVVSHLHDDHVNGLEYLLKDMKADTVVMPYTNEGLKLLARLESHSDDEFLQEFYADPVAWFLSKGVRRILLIGSEETPEREDASYGAYIEDEDSDIESPSIIKIEHIDAYKTEIIHLTSKTNISCRDFCWEFHFENLNLQSSAAYINAVEAFKQKKCLTLEQIFKSRLLSDDLRNEVKKALSGNDSLNRTSVAMLHRPAAGSVFSMCNLCNCPLMKNRIKFFIGLTGKCILKNTILTGDIELKKGERLEMLDPYIKSPEDNALLQYPHHGADSNNNIAYFNSLEAKANVLSYGVANRHGHPHARVLGQLQNIVFVNERESFNYQIMVKD